MNGDGPPGMPYTPNGLRAYCPKTYCSSSVIGFVNDVSATMFGIYEKKSPIALEIATRPKASLAVLANRTITRK